MTRAGVYRARRDARDIPDPRLLAIRLHGVEFGLNPDLEHATSFAYPRELASSAAVIVARVYASRNRDDLTSSLLPSNYLGDLARFPLAPATAKTEI